MLIWLILIGAGLAVAAERSGVWQAKDANKTITLTLKITGADLTGKLEGVQGIMQLQGTVQGDTAEGTVSNANGTAYFKIVFSLDSLSLTLANFDAAGKPDSSSAVTFTLKRPESAKEETSFYIAGFDRDPLPGSWVNPSLRLELQGVNGKYTGRITMGKDSAPVVATGSAQGLKGSFKLGKVTKSFTAQLLQGKLLLKLDGKSYTLTRKK